jgi:hypothetical protein
VSIIAQFVLFVSVAWATPDRGMSSDDRLLAATQTHIYVLRDVVDNLGSYYEKLHDQHLIEISIDTGEATRFWPVRRMFVANLDENADVIPGYVTERDGDTNDPFAILLELRAEPMTPRGWLLDGLVMTDGAVTQGGTVILTPFGIRAAGRAQLAILRDEYPPIETEEEYFAREVMDFYDLYAEGDWVCTLDPKAVVLRRPTDVVRVAKLECEMADGVSFASFHIFAKDEL